MIMCSIYEFGDVKGMKIGHWNVRSLQYKIETFRIYMEILKFNIIGISESWLKTAITNGIVNCKGYNIARNDRAWCDPGKTEVKDGGGVMLLIDENMLYNDKVLEHLNRSDKDIEVQWILVSIPNQKDIIVANIYRPPQGNVREFIRYLNVVFKT